MIRRLLIITLAALPLAGRAAAQTSIELRSSVTLKAGAPITVGDVADVEGEDAEAIMDTVVERDPPTRAFDIDVKAVRAALGAAKVVRWGKTTLRGSTCSVILMGDESAAAAKKNADEPARQRPEVVRLDGPETVRTHVATSLARMYAVGANDLRLLFDDRDKELLDTPAANRRVDIQPTNSATTSTRVGLRTYVFSGDRLLMQRTISVEVLVRRTVLSAVAPIPRGHEIDASDFTASEQWHAPSAAVPCTAEQAVGAVAKARINAGQVISEASIEAPIVVKKGDIVEVHCLAGAVHLKATRARALAAGRDGEIVSFQLEGSKHSFKARMSGRGTAVLVLDTGADLGAETREAHR
jgi:flagella basal body P-ring formation protein FlgA